MHREQIIVHLSPYYKYKILFRTIRLRAYLFYRFRSFEAFSFPRFLILEQLDYLLQLTQNDLTHELTYKTFFLYFDISLRESYTLKRNLSTIFPLASSSPT